jgi:hypothetical protein
MMNLPDILRPFYLAYAKWGEFMVQTNRVMDQRLETTHGQLIFNRTALAQVCPCCCCRSEPSQANEENCQTQYASDADQMLILVTDGNFQHRRLKMARLQGRDYNTLTTPMFISGADGDYCAEWDLYKGGLTGCANTFTAANKPSTFKHWEETGLLGISCR